MEFDFLGALSTDVVVQASVAIVVLAVIIIILALVIFFIRNKKSPEERAARAVLKRLELAKKGKLKKAPPQKSWASPAEQQPTLASSPQTPFSSSETTSPAPPVSQASSSSEPSGFSLKQMLIEKFKPSIEKQLKTSVEVLNLSASGENFFAQVEIAGTKLLLTLDPAGKIIDYKKV